MTHTYTDDDDAAGILERLSGFEPEYFSFLKPRHSSQHMLGIHLRLSGGKVVHEIWINNSHDSRAALGHVVTEWLRMNHKYGRPSWQLLVEAMRMVDFRPCFKLEEAVIDLQDLQNNFLVRVNNIYD